MFYNSLPVDRIHKKNICLLFQKNREINIRLFIILACVYMATIIVYLCLATKLNILAGRAIKLACTNNCIMIFMDIALFNIFRTVKLPF